MAITNGYGTLPVYKDRFDIEDNKDDATIEAAITAVSRLIDELCWQRFFTTSADETRYFTASHGDYLQAELPIISITTLKTDRDGDRTYETTWATSDYDLMPFNATADSEPYQYIQVTPNGDNSFPKIAKGVEIDGKFGWSSIPAPIVEACYLGAHRMIKRLDTPLGVSAAAALGQLQVKVQQLKADPDFMALVNLHKRQL
jgi:hypothetical protein